MNSACRVAERLERAFVRIQHERMADLPFLNPALSVEAVGFRSWRDEWLGVLVTPWFISFILLPGVPAERREWRTGRKRLLEFPAGRFEFIEAEAEGVGPFAACSLFSPVLQFRNQEAALVAAEAALEALLSPPERETEERCHAARKRRHPQTASPEKPVLSRRAFLMGRLHVREG